MPRSADSSPNFDFLDDGSAVHGDSATNLIDPPADGAETGDPFDFSADETAEDRASDTPDEPTAPQPPAIDEPPAEPKAPEQRGGKRKSSRKRPAAASPFEESEVDDEKPAARTVDDETAELGDLPEQVTRKPKSSKPKVSSEPSETVDLGDLRDRLDEPPEDFASEPDDTTEHVATESQPKRSKKRRSSSKRSQPPGQQVAEPQPSRSRSSKSKRPARDADEPTPSRSASRRGPSRKGKKPGFDWEGIREAGGQTLLIALGTYAGLATLAIFWLLSSQTEDSRLENLPDVTPIDRKSIQYIAPTAAVPEGHTIPLGGAEQFGYIKIEPLRVTQEPVGFVHESGDDRETSLRLDKVPLKLHVRLTNMSPTDDAGQNIAPLDRHLLYHRMSTGDYGENVKSNQYVYSPKEPSKPAAMLVELAPEGEWVLEGQELPVLAPGESVETFIAANPPETMDGRLVWRVQLRKGYHLPTGHGVTTLVDVPFDAGSING